MLDIDVHPFATRVKISPHDPLHVIQGDYMDKTTKFDEYYKIRYYKIILLLLSINYFDVPI